MANDKEIRISLNTLIFSLIIVILLLYIVYLSFFKQPYTYQTIVTPKLNSTTSVKNTSLATSTILSNNTTTMIQYNTTTVTQFSSLGCHSVSFTEYNKSLGKSKWFTISCSNASINTNDQLSVLLSAINISYYNLELGCSAPGTLPNVYFGVNSSGYASLPGFSGNASLLSGGSLYVKKIQCYGYNMPLKKGINYTLDIWATYTPEMGPENVNNSFGTAIFPSLTASPS